MKKKYLVTVSYLILGNFLFAQSFFPAHNYPNADFRNPLNIPFSLVGNFGECRPNHFHSGIDIRTDSKENLPVFAIKEGYVSRVKIDNSGFGNAIYITHANGFTSLYAHLNKFYPELENYVRAKQYEQKTWKIDMQFLPHQFPIQKNKFIAFSGNTGHSSGPHLHLEIRDAKSENPLNGLLFFKEINDKKAPIIHQLAIYDGSESIYSQSPQLITVSQNGNESRLTNQNIKVHSNKAFFGINGDDYMEISKGVLGIYEMRMYVDDKAFFAWQLDNISYNITRYMNAMADYKLKTKKGPWVQLCRQLPNDKLGIYKSFSPSNGVIDLSDGKLKKIRIETYDTKGNMSQINFTIVSDNTKPQATYACQMIQNSKEQNFKNDNMEINFPADAIYDNVCFDAAIKPSTQKYSHRYQLHYDYVPIHSFIDVSIKPKANIPATLADKVTLVKYNGNTKSKGLQARLVNGMVMARLKDLGDYEINIDTKAPSITSTIRNGDNISKSKYLTFVVKEDVTSVATCEASVDGQWLRLVQKGTNYTYELDDHFPKGTHNLTVKASDENNNTITQTFKLTR